MALQMVLIPDSMPLRCRSAHSVHEHDAQMESLQSDKPPTGPLYDLPSWIAANYPQMEVRPKR
jgi:hypothetical protein